MQFRYAVHDFTIEKIKIKNILHIVPLFALLFLLSTFKNV